MERSKEVKIPVLLLSAYYFFIPMDKTQFDHLRAYGVVYNTLRGGLKVEWILNYRGGSFLVEENKLTLQLLNTLGVTFEILPEEKVVELKSKAENSNMEFVILENPPKVAVYAPPYYEPWDDPVVMVLNYAQIPFTQIYDEEVLTGKLNEFDWVHLHHEDFTGQFGKFYASYGNTDWYRTQVTFKKETANKLGFTNVIELERAVVREFSEFVKSGKYLFAMCSAPVTLNIALASEGVDIHDVPFDGTPFDPACNERLDYSKTLCFKDFRVIPQYYIYEHSDIDMTNEIAMRGEDSYFLLREFSAKIDLIPCILTQNHTKVIKDFLGQDTGFRRSKLKDNVVILADLPGTEYVKYLYGEYGKGFFSFLGGHDPEDFQHFVGDPPTDIALHKNSPGYRLILNNLLLPSAQKKRLKT
ncbi:MAG: asparagine synthetase B [candidate division WOR-3 bacterium]